MADAETGRRNALRVHVLVLEPDIFVGELETKLGDHGVLCTLKGCELQADLVETVRQARDRGHPFEGIFARLGLAFDESVFAAAGSLECVITPTTGLSHIDTSAADRYGVKILSLRDHPEFLRTIASTAEHTWSLLLTVIRRIPSAYQDVLAGNWARQPHMGVELSGKTLGVFGLGRLGSMVANYGRAFRMRVIATDTNDAAFCHDINRHVERVDAETLFALSDIVSVHLPLVEGTIGIVNASLISKMKTGAILINTARGELIDEEALLRALKSGHLAAAGLDVLSNDAVWEGRMPIHHPMLEYGRSNPNLVITPHVGGFTYEAVRRTRSFMVDRFIEWLGSKRI